MGKLDTVHVIDDDEFVRYSIDLLLTADGFVVETYSSARDFLMVGPSDNEGCVLTDLHMPGMTGIDLLSEISHRRLNWPVILMTAQGTTELRERASSLGAIEFLTKPVLPEVLAAAVRRALGSREGGGIKTTGQRYHPGRAACR
jgi:FixJ family two-component response regulator